MIETRPNDRRFEENEIEPGGRLAWADVHHIESPYLADGLVAECFWGRLQDKG